MTHHYSDDDLTLYSNTLIVEKYGWEMIEKLLKQDMQFVRSHVLVAQETAKGERPVTFDQISQFNTVRFVAPDDLDGLSARTGRVLVGPGVAHRQRVVDGRIGAGGRRGLVASLGGLAGGERQQKEHEPLQWDLGRGGWTRFIFLS